jgi:uncharacterized membrane-anchored protein YitT (DUF2179 family)
LENLRAKSLAGTLLLSLWVSLFGQLTDYNGFLPYIDRMDTLLSAIFGGVLLGSGIGCHAIRCKHRRNGHHRPDSLALTPLPLGTALFLSDASVIVLGAVVFGLERALFAVITLYLSGQMVNFVVMNLGTKYAKTAYIVSERHEAIGKRIITELHHGGTLISGVGIFTDASGPCCWRWCTTSRSTTSPDCPPRGPESFHVRTWKPIKPWARGSYRCRS